MTHIYYHMFLLQNIPLTVVQAMESETSSLSPLPPYPLTPPLPFDVVAMVKSSTDQQDAQLTLNSTIPPDQQPTIILLVPLPLPFDVDAVVQSSTDQQDAQRTVNSTI